MTKQELMMFNRLLTIDIAGRLTQEKDVDVLCDFARLLYSRQVKREEDENGVVKRDTPIRNSKKEAL